MDEANVRMWMEDGVDGYHDLTGGCYVRRVSYSSFPTMQLEIGRFRMASMPPCRVMCSVVCDPYMPVATRSLCTKKLIHSGGFDREHLHKQEYSEIRVRSGCTRRALQDRVVALKYNGAFLTHL